MPFCYIYIHCSNTHLRLSHLYHHPLNMTLLKIKCWKSSAQCCGILPTPTQSIFFVILVFYFLENYMHHHILSSHVICSGWLFSRKHFGILEFWNFPVMILFVLLQHMKFLFILAFTFLKSSLHILRSSIFSRNFVISQMHDLLWVTSFKKAFWNFTAMTLLSQQAHEVNSSFWLSLSWEIFVVPFHSFTETWLSHMICCAWLLSRKYLGILMPGIVLWHLHRLFFSLVAVFLFLENI